MLHYTNTGKEVLIIVRSVVKFSFETLRLIVSTSNFPPPRGPFPSCEAGKISGKVRVLSIAEIDMFMGLFVFSPRVNSTFSALCRDAIKFELDLAFYTLGLVWATTLFRACTSRLVM